MPAEPIPPDRSARWRLAFTGTLALAMGSGTYLGYAFGVLGPDLVAEFDLSRFQLGLLTTVLFVVGGPLSLVAGRATDHFGARRVMLVAFTVTAGAVVGIAISPGYPLVLGAAAVAGVALAAGNPVTNKLVAEHLPRGSRGLTMGGKQAGVQVGAFLAGVVLAPVAVSAGWRAALGWSAVIPALAIVVVLAVVPRDPPPAPPEAAAPRSHSTHSVRLLMAYAFLMGTGVAAVNAYLPLYLVERAGASSGVAGSVVATIGLVGIVSRVSWGWASERMRSLNGPLLALGLGAAAAIALIAAVEPLGLWVAWPAAALFGASAITWNAVGMLAVITESGTRRAGRASGVVTFGFYIGFVASPVAFGWLVDRMDGYLLAWGLVAAAFLATAPVVTLRSRASRLQTGDGGAVRSG